MFRALLPQYLYEPIRPLANTGSVKPHGHFVLGVDGFLRGYLEIMNRTLVMVRVGKVTLEMWLQNTSYPIQNVISNVTISITLSK